MRIAEALAHYFAAWKESDATKTRGHLARSYAQDVRFIDPANQVQRIDAMAAMIGEAHTAMNAEYVRTSGIDGHNKRYRFRWAVPRTGHAAFRGMETTTLNVAGLIDCINGFFGDPHHTNSASRRVTRLHQQQPSNLMSYSTTVGQRPCGHIREGSVDVLEVGEGNCNRWAFVGSRGRR